MKIPNKLNSSFINSPISSSNTITKIVANKPVSNIFILLYLDSVKYLILKIDSTSYEKIISSFVQYTLSDG